MARTFTLGFVSAMVLTTAVLLTWPAAAHTFGGAVDGGFGAGFVHPFLGLDHLLAMVAVGLWAACLGGPARVFVPVAFVAAMAAAGLASAAGTALPLVETAIALSLIALGALLIARVRMPLAAGAALVGVFAIFHGHAHGAEIPDAASPAVYALGFVLATAILHAIGLGIGTALLGAGHTAGGRLMRVAGSGVAAAGLLLLVL